MPLLYFGYSGGRTRLGWRTLVGVVLVATLFLHGFDPSFSVDG